ncbi:MAG: hypothetical protein WC465_04360 [Patescibacteria group bacterium]
MEKNKTPLKNLLTAYGQFFQKIGGELIVFAIIIGLYYESLTTNYRLMFTQYIPLENLPFFDLNIIFSLYTIAGTLLALASILYIWSYGHNNKKIKYIVLIFLFSLQIPLVINILQEKANRRPLLFINDSGVQSEIATDFILSGKDPYQKNYHQTILGQKFDQIGWISLGQRYKVPNPALTSYAYMPLSFLLPLPIKMISDAVWHFYDQRLFLALCYLLTIWIVYRLSGYKKNKFVFLIFMLFNPLLLEQIWFGFNDIGGLMFLLLAILLLKKQRFKGAVAAVALAALYKQNFIFYWPFFLFYIYLKEVKNIKQVSRLWPYIVIMAGLTIAVIGPFVFWHDSAFWHDTIYYLGHEYPARGIGLAGLLLQLRVIKSPFAYYNFALWQIAYILLILPWLLKQQIKNNSPAKVYLYGTILMGGVWFLSRYFHESHFNFILTSFLIYLFL